MSHQHAVKPRHVKRGQNLTYDGEPAFVVQSAEEPDNADAWTIARPLVFFIALPLLFGVVTRGVAKPFSESAAPIIKKIAGIDTVIMVGSIGATYSALLEPMRSGRS